MVNKCVHIILYRGIRDVLEKGRLYVARPKRSALIKLFSHSFKNNFD